MIDLNNIIIINLSAENEQEILQNLKTLLTTPAGTVVFDRDFGIDTSFLDMPLEISKTMLVMEYTKKINKYMNYISVKEIIFEENKNVLIPKVVIE